MSDSVESALGQFIKQKPAIKPNQEDSNIKTFQATRVNQAEEVKDKEIWDACCQFEAIFLQQMMSAMRKTVPESEFLPRGYADSMYEGMMDQAISESGSKQGPLGLAMNMYRQLQRDGQYQGAGTPTIQDIQQATDTIKSSDFINKAKQGGI